MGKKPAKRKLRKASLAAQKANPDLVEFYRFGCQILEEQRKNSEYLEHFLQETGRSEYDIYCARKFARICLDGELDFEELCQLGSQVGHPLRRCHLYRLIYVSDKRKRTSLARKAAKQGWSVRRLNDEIRKTKPMHRKQGRLGNRPPTVLDALVDIEKMVRRFSRIADVLQVPEEDEADGVSWKDLPRSVKISLRRIFKECDSLQTALDKQIAK